MRKIFITFFCMLCGITPYAFGHDHVEGASVADDIESITHRVRAHLIQESNILRRAKVVVDRQDHQSRFSVTHRFRLTLDEKPVWNMSLLHVQTRGKEMRTRINIPEIARVQKADEEITEALRQQFSTEVFQPQEGYFRRDETLVPAIKVFQSNGEVLGGSFLIFSTHDGSFLTKIPAVRK